MDLAGRAVSTASILFHSVVSERLGLQPSEEKAIELLLRFGPITAGELSERAGLAPASVTGLVDRLERKGFARRVPDQVDKRRVRIEVEPSAMGKFQPLFADFVARLHQLYERYSDDELTLIQRYLSEVSEVQRAATEALRAQGEEKK